MEFVCFGGFEIFKNDWSCRLDDFPFGNFLERDGYYSAGNWVYRDRFRESECFLAVNLERDWRVITGEFEDFFGFVVGGLSEDFGLSAINNRWNEAGLSEGERFLPCFGADAQT